MGIFTVGSRTWAAAEILTAANMNAQLRDFIDGFGAWIAYSPAWTSSGTAPALGNGTLTGSYTQIQKMVWFRLLLTAGTTTTFGTGNYTFSLPVTCTQAGNTVLGTAGVFDSSAGARYNAVTYLNTSTTLYVMTQAAAGASATVAATSPMTFATSDVVSVVGMYEA